MIEVGTAKALSELERPYISLLPYCDWRGQELEECDDDGSDKFVGVELCGRYEEQTEPTDDGGIDAAFDELGDTEIDKEGDL